MWIGLIGTRARSATHDFRSRLVAGAYAYRADRSALDAVLHVHKLMNTGRGKIVDADLSSYFDSVLHAGLMRSVCMNSASQTRWAPLSVRSASSYSTAGMHDLHCFMTRGMCRKSAATVEMPTDTSDLFSKTARYPLLIQFQRRTFIAPAMALRMH
jgi:hypothetical protein